MFLSYFFGKRMVEDAGANWWCLMKQGPEMMERDRVRGISMRLPFSRSMAAIYSDPRENVGRVLRLEEQ